MEIKIVLKDGERSSTFKFAGDPMDVIAGIGKQFSDTVATVRKFVEGDNQCHAG